MLYYYKRREIKNNNGKSVIKVNKGGEKVGLEREGKRAKLYTEQSGITLLALVITILVLLILAGVSINAVLGENGIIPKSKEAQNKMNESAESDLTGLNELNAWIEKQTKGVNDLGES